ncbi:PEGA domain-containing protein [Patescibacteria group bacterium]|nr:PEGA domain-containing protein [Patescibacteria group bacterium]MBU1074451.1 PEGA domain-containing protein [Patescibacteria group bacterium]MBU1952104.1 PEGA domain-containing protein [Patescibacteria group bacterium]
MKKKYRRIYAFTLVLVFIVVAPLLVLYATGYRYDFDDHKVIKTGVLSVDSDPRNAQITINGGKFGSKTPTVIKNLFPGDYSVIIEKEDYFTWEKTLQVFPNRSTSTERVSLLKSSSPTLVVEERVSNIVFSPNDSYLAYTIVNEKKTNDLIIKQQGTLRTIHSIEGIDVKTKLAFSSNANYVYLINPETNYITRIISVDGQYDIILDLISPSYIPIKRITESSKANVLYAISESGIKQINVEEKTFKRFVDGIIQDVVEIGQSIYYIEVQENVSVLMKADLNDLDNSHKLLTLSHNSECLLSYITQNYLTLHDIQNNELSLIGIQDQFSLKLNKLNLNVSRFVWSPDENNLLLYNDFEIWLFNPEQDQQELLIRSSKQIKYADWSPDGRWMIYSHEGFIKAIELDGREKRNIVNLAQTDIIPFAVNKNNKVLFFHDSSQNLFQQPIQ